MGIVNVTPDSFHGPSRVTADTAPARIGRMVEEGAAIIDIGAVSTRPGAPDVPVDEEWRRLEPVLKLCGGNVVVSVDTTRAEIVRRTYELVGNFIVNDVSAGEDDPEMLPIVGDLGLGYVAMHKRGNPRTMDSLAVYPEGVVKSVLDYFDSFSLKAGMFGIRDWILDPGFGFSKSEGQNLELLESLDEFGRFGKKVLAGIADKRFTRGMTEELQVKAVRNGADILRVHDVAAAVESLKANNLWI